MIWDNLLNFVLLNHIPHLLVDFERDFSNHSQKICIWKYHSQRTFTWWLPFINNYYHGPKWKLKSNETRGWQAIYKNIHWKFPSNLINAFLKIFFQVSLQTACCRWLKINAINASCVEFKSFLLYEQWILKKLVSEIKSIAVNASDVPRREVAFLLGLPKIVARNNSILVLAKSLLMYSARFIYTVTLPCYHSYQQ